jgi:hypothetical protein
MKKYRGVVVIHELLTTALHGDQWSASGLGHFTLVRFGYDAGKPPQPVRRLRRRQNLCPYKESNPDSSVFHRCLNTAD